jgi:hypothetical protein
VPRAGPTLHAVADLRGWIELPEGWAREAARGPWPFVTAERYRRPDGTSIAWSSRSHRKRSIDPVGSTWWAPRARGWWIGVLFAVGSVCFALGSFPPYALAVGESADDVTYFVGSIFFTSAAFLQFREAVLAARGPQSAGADPTRPGSWRILGWAPWRIDWWSTSVQLVGTVFFNVSTFAATRHGLDVRQADHRVWVPDVVGSICFLVASALAWAEVGHAWLSWRPASLGWRIAAVNMVGSIAFGVSAVAAYVVPDTGDLVNTALANLGTFVGALCFFAGALMLLPERTQAIRPGEPD